ncbi:aldose epimerase family protein [Chitinophaga lutea]
MAFSIHHLNKDGFDLIELRDEEGAYVQVIAGIGALLHAFVVPHKDGPLNVVDSYKDLADYRSNVTGSFKNVKLSPFACRIREAAYTWYGKDYKVQKSPIHGLLYDEAFTLIMEEAGDKGAVIDLEHHYRGTDPGYPFPYTCNVRYRLLPENTLEVTTTILNHHTAPIPIMDGWHPYFTTGSPVDELELQFWSTEIVEFDAKLIPTGKKLPYSEFAAAKSMKDVKLDNSFILDFGKKGLLCTLRDPKKGVSIGFQPSEAYPILQVYTPPHRRSIAIENLTGAPDAFNNGLGLVTVAPGASEQFTAAITVTV